MAKREDPVQPGFLFWIKQSLGFDSVLEYVSRCKPDAVPAMVLEEITPRRTQKI